MMADNMAPICLPTSMDFAIEPDLSTNKAVGRVILACQQAGIQKVGFITEPHKLDASSY